MSAPEDGLPPVIALIGLMGAGKTAVGARLAAMLGRPFADLDAEIERAAGRSIAAIFAEDGEARFRALEEEALAEALAGAAARTGARDRPGEGPGLVLALGGGAVLAAANRARLAAAGAACAWLEAPPEVLAARTGGDLRPLLRGLDHAGRAARLAALLAERAPAYAAAATCRVEGGDRVPDEVAADLLGALASPRRIPVPLVGGRAYDVVIDAGGLDRLGAHLLALGARPGPIALMTCRNVQGIHGERALAALGAAGFKPVVIALPPGEGAKRLAEVERACALLAAAGLDQRGLVVGLGGGAVTDVAGFVASIYRRGVGWVACPTTLLGMVDAAIGGKTAVNLAAGKNLVGAFHQPRLVLADPRALATLPAREVRSGLGEVLKYGLIGPAETFAWLDRHLDRLLDARGRVGPAQHLLIEAIARSVAMKARIVAEDEREESGARKALNFGHTIGHGLEAAFGFAGLTHGEAVILGMRAAVRLSVRRGLLDDALAARLERFLDRVRTPALPPPLPVRGILAYVDQDKKFVAGRRLFVLLRGPGDPAIDIEVPQDEVEAAIASLA